MSNVVCTVGHSRRLRRSGLATAMIRDLRTPAGATLRSAAMPTICRRPNFAADLAGVVEQASRARVALMCAESVPWRCHRSLIADVLVVHRIRVEEIISPIPTQALEQPS